MHFHFLAGQRESTVSSITTASSNQDELSRALDNAPPLAAIPASEYEQRDTLSTDASSVPTEPGIRHFTQTPPRPAETRTATCQRPLYEGMS